MYFRSIPAHPPIPQSRQLCRIRHLLSRPFPLLGAVRVVELVGWLVWLVGVLVRRVGRVDQMYPTRASKTTITTTRRRTTHRHTAQNHTAINGGSGGGGWVWSVGGLGAVLFRQSPTISHSEHRDITTTCSLARSSPIHNHPPQQQQQQKHLHPSHAYYTTNTAVVAAPPPPSTIPPTNIANTDHCAPSSSDVVVVVVATANAAVALRYSLCFCRCRRTHIIRPSP